MSAPEHIVSKIAAFKGGRVLMGLRRDDKKWCFPGGHLDAGESAKRAAHRELKEETGFEPLYLKPLGSKRVKDGKVQVHAFRADVDGEPHVDLDPDAEFTAFKWVNPKAMPPEVMKNLHSAPDVMLELLGARAAGATRWGSMQGAA